MTIKESVHLRKEQVVLDFGCGDGLFAIELAKSPAKIIGLDLNKTVIERARKYIRYSARRKRLDFRIGQIEELRLESGSVDIVFCVCVLQLVENLPQVLSELHRILKPNGEIHATVDSFAYIQDENLRDTYKHTHYIVEYFTETTIATYFQRAGFTITALEPILKGETAKSHFARYFQDSHIFYGLFDRYSMVTKIAGEDRTCSNRVPGAELLVRARKLAP